MDLPAGLVTVEDIRDRSHRALTPDDERVIPAWITDAWERLLGIKDLRLRERLADPPEDGLIDLVALAVRGAVLNRLRNPQGRRQYSYSVDDATVSETIATETLTHGWFDDEDLASLAPVDSVEGAFTIRPARTTRRPEADPWISL